MRQIESRDSGTKLNKRPVEFRDIGTVPELSGILVPKCRDLFSRGILVAELSRLSLGFESRSRSWESAGRDRDPVIVPGPIPRILKATGQSGPGQKSAGQSRY